MANNKIQKNSNVEAEVMNKKKKKNLAIHSKEAILAIN